MEAFAPESIKEEVETAYAFLCEAPRVLRQPLRMRGHLRLWHLDPQLVAGLELAAPPSVCPRVPTHTLQCS